VAECEVGGRTLVYLALVGTPFRTPPDLLKDVSLSVSVLQVSHVDLARPLQRSSVVSLTHFLLTASLITLDLGDGGHSAFSALRLGDVLTPGNIVSVLGSRQVAEVLVLSRLS
jgi:hypothetical protein